MDTFVAAVLYSVSSSAGIYLLHWPKYNMHLRLKTEPVTAGTDAWYSSGFCFHTVHFCICTGHEKQTDWVFMPELRLFLGHFNYCCYFLVSRSWFLSVADLTLHSNLSVFLFCWYYNCKKYKNKKRKGKRTLMDRCSWPTASWVMPGQLAASLSSMTWRRWDFRSRWFPNLRRFYRNR